LVFFNVYNIFSRLKSKHMKHANFLRIFALAAPLGITAMATATAAATPALLTQLSTFNEPLIL
jgi:hypothetical protein